MFSKQEETLGNSELCDLLNSMEDPSLVCRVSLLRACQRRNTGVEANIEGKLGNSRICVAQDLHLPEHFRSPG